MILAAGYAWFPRGTAGLADAKREAGAIEAEEGSRAPEGVG
jgi:hypothetical protein